MGLTDTQISRPKSPADTQLTDAEGQTSQLDVQIARHDQDRGISRAVSPALLDVGEPPAQEAADPAGPGRSLDAETPHTPR